MQKSGQQLLLLLFSPFLLATEPAKPSAGLTIFIIACNMRASASACIGTLPNGAGMQVPSAGVNLRLGFIFSFNEGKTLFGSIKNLISLNLRWPYCFVYSDRKSFNTWFWGTEFPYVSMASNLVEGEQKFFPFPKHFMTLKDWLSSFTGGLTRNIDLMIYALTLAWLLKKKMTISLECRLSTRSSTSEWQTIRKFFTLSAEHKGKQTSQVCPFIFLTVSLAGFLYEFLLKK